MSYRPAAPGYRPDGHNPDDDNPYRRTDAWRTLNRNEAAQLARDRADYDDMQEREAIGQGLISLKPTEIMAAFRAGLISRQEANRRLGLPIEPEAKPTTGTATTAPISGDERARLRAEFTPLVHVIHIALSIATHGLWLIVYAHALWRAYIAK